MKKILFLHGFYASGQCVPAMVLREAFAGRAEVITPDLPMHPKEAVRFICELTDREQPDLLIGNSCGAFYAQMVAPVVGIMRKILLDAHTHTVASGHALPQYSHRVR